ncbi:MAG: bifunctional DNA-formamidopyrimidine glycosylase/DNA-(apurinic or apyrimidinic site) lyase [Myxococcales bacterium]|nr:bifunctional DNA-formamidopyrimidine glycosylase/DNA-(apurinic or apyrimidinic site) lyase [Myxococcales bacterium]
MPELPEVETVCRGLRGFLEHHTLTDVVVRRRDLRIPIPSDFEARLRGRTVQQLSRRAKYILGFLDGDDVLIAHLGMSGRLFGYRAGDPKRPTEPAKHDHVWLRTEEDTLLCYTDPRRFGLLTLCPKNKLAEHPLLKDLGIEPLSAELTPRFLSDALSRKQVPIKVALLDQAVIVGIGNIYASEILFRAHISPLRPASSLTPTERAALCPSIVAILQRAIDAGGSTLRDYVQADGELGSFQDLFAVYDREGTPCQRRACRGTIQRIVQAARATYFCPSCQH